MNRLYVGLSKNVELPKGGCLLISDEVPDVPRARVFDPLKHSFNPLKNIDYRKAREIADILYTVSPQGENTLTVRNGKRALLRLLLEGYARFDKISPKTSDDSTDEALASIGDVLMSPVLKRVLCSPTNFSFNPRSTILARVNRAELGDFDALVLGLFLMAEFTGQLVVPDFGFYGRDMHARYVREDRLIAGVDVLAELSPKLRQQVLLVPVKVPAGVTYDDAETIAKYEGYRTGTNAFNDFVFKAMHGSRAGEL